MPRPSNHRLRNLVDNYPSMSGNDSRKALRSLVADLYDADVLFNQTQTMGITGLHGKTFRHFIDQVDRVVLWNLIGVGYNFIDQGTTATLLQTGLSDKRMCRPKQRGSGTSYASHQGLYDEATAIALADKMLTNEGHPPSHTPTQTNQPQGTTMDKIIVPVTPTELASLALALTLHNNPHIDDQQQAEPIVNDMLEYLYSQADEPVDDVTKQGALSTAILMMTGDPDWHNKAEEYATAHDCWAAVRDAYTLQAVRGTYAEEPDDEPEDDAPTIETIEVEKNMANIINASLGAATNGLVNDINAVLKSVTDLTIENHKLKSMPAAVPQAPKATSGDIGDLHYDVVPVDAAKVFGKRSPALKFDVPSIVWKDSDGNVVTHPQTPDVDPVYEFRIEHLIKFLTAHFFGQNIWIHGDTGTGKTTLAEQIAARLGFPVYRLNLDSAIERADIIGSTQLREENGVMVSKFVDGMLPQAMALPAFFILDEMDAGHPDVLFAIQRALEAKGLVLTEDGGRVVQANDHFRFIATANTRGQGDEKGWYAGVRPMNVATLDRFATFIEVGYLDPRTERKLLSNKFPSLTDTDLTEFTELSKKIRDAFKNGELSTTISPRGMTAFCQTYLHFKTVLNTRKDAVDHALEMVIVDRAPIDSQTKVQEFARLCIN